MYAVFTGTMLLVRPLVGYCLDRFGRRWFFTAAFAFYALAMTVFATSAGIGDFYLARFLQGIGASLMWVTVRTMIADLHAAERRGAAMGRLTTTSVQGSMIGAVWGFTLLGFMPLRDAWLWGFGGYALAALAALAYSLIRVPETCRHDPRHGRPRLTWTADLRRALVLVSLSAFASALIEPIYLLFLRHKFALDTVGLAIAFLPAGLVYAVLPRYAGAWSDRYGRAPIIAMGVVLAGVVSAALPFWPSIVLVALSYVAFAVGWAMASPAEEALVADLAPAGLRGTVIGAKEAAAGVGAALGPLAGGLIYEHIAQPAAFLANALLLCLTALLAVAWFGSRSYDKGPRRR